MGIHLREKRIIVASLIKQDTRLSDIMRHLDSKPGFWMQQDGILVFQGRVWVHHSKYKVHPGSTKMHHNLKLGYRCNGMKKQIVPYVKSCATCQQVKAKHRRPAGKLQSLDILEWKWDHVTMDFVVGLPRT